MAEIPWERSTLTSVIRHPPRRHAAPYLTSRWAGAPGGKEIRIGRHRLSVTFSLSARQVELLDLLAQRTNVPKSVYVRKGVDVILRRYRGLLGTGPATADEDENEKG